MSVAHARSGERGAVLVMVAVLMPVFIGFLAFGVDTAHWWVHHRHLQTQADAGAFAGALGPWLPVCDEAGIEKQVRDYSGDPGNGPVYNGQYSNAGNVSVRINSTVYSNNPADDFSDTGKPCSTLQNASPGHPGFLDVKVKEANLGTFFGTFAGFGSVTTDAHARVEIQQVGSEDNVRPIAVRDDASYRCARVDFYNYSTGTLVAGFNLGTRTDLSDGSTQFANPGGNAVTMPATAGQHLFMRTTLSDCLGNSEVFPQDASGAVVPQVGVSFVNAYSNLPLAIPGANQAPSIGSVTLLPGPCTPDQYFSTIGCSVTVKAYVAFPPGAITSGNNQNAFVTVNGPTNQATAASDPNGLYWTYTVSFSAQSGPQTYTIGWEKQYGTVGTTGCKKNGNPQACKGSYGVQQASFSATDDDSVVNSGPLKLVQIGEVGQSVVGANSFKQGTTHTLTVVVQVAGLSNTDPNGPPTVIRFSNQNSKRTGVIDCGQDKNGANQAAQAIISGCPRAIAIWATGTPCTTVSNSSAPTPIDCVDPVPGNKRGPIITAIEQRINGGCNYWYDYTHSPFKAPKPSDPRLMTVVLTGPADLSGKVNAGPIPILKLATFYVTGYDGGVPGPQGCGSNYDNDPYPGQGSDKNKFWGYWLQYVPAGGQGNGQACIPNQFGDCVAVLTQ